MIRTIPLNKLIASPRNVRRSSDPAADAELKADIAARGLLQNLVVTPVSKPRGRFAVEAGERRRKALLSLAGEGSLPADHEVACLVIDGAVAQEASLAENFQRLAMNPADECLAFQQLIEQGSDAATIARRFGLTVRFVEGRLRLAGLAPVVFEALGTGTIGLEVAKAYAATADRDRQAYVFDQVSRSYMASHPDTIRRMMVHATLGAGDRRARFVGEDCYVAAGGRVERDLFADEVDARWLDVALVERLAAEKLEAAAAAMVAETGLGWIRPFLGDWIGFAETDGLRRIELESPALSDAESAEVDALEAEIASLAAIADDEDADAEARQAAEGRMAELGDRIDAIVSKPPVIDDEMKPRAGAFLVLDREGRPSLDPRRFVEEPEDGDGGGEAPEDGRDGDEEAAKSDRPTLSRRFADELAMQRRDVLAVHVAADGGFAFDLAAFLMTDGECRHAFEPAGSALRAGRPSDPVPEFGTPDAAATVALAAVSEALDRSWTEGATRAERFDAFRALPEASRQSWFSLAVARTLEASAGGPGGRGCAFHDRLGQLLGIEPERWWRPTAANYFDRVPKSAALAALTEVGGAELAGRYGKLKKTELAEACERVFAGEFIAEAQVKQAALAWVPQAMRFGTAEPTEVAEGTDVAVAPAAAGECDAPQGTASEGDDAAAGVDGRDPLEEIGQAA